MTVLWTQFLFFWQKWECSFVSHCNNFTVFCNKNASRTFTSPNPSLLPPTAAVSPGMQCASGPDMPLCARIKCLSVWGERWAAKRIVFGIWWVIRSVTLRRQTNKQTNNHSNNNRQQQQQPQNQKPKLQHQGFSGTSKSNSLRKKEVRHSCQKAEIK